MLYVIHSIYSEKSDSAGLNSLPNHMTIIRPEQESNLQRISPISSLVSINKQVRR